MSSNAYRRWRLRYELFPFPSPPGGGHSFRNSIRVVSLCPPIVFRCKVTLVYPIPFGRVHLPSSLLTRSPVGISPSSLPHDACHFSKHLPHFFKKNKTFQIPLFLRLYSALRVTRFAVLPSVFAHSPLTPVDDLIVAFVLLTNYTLVTPCRVWRRSFRITFRPHFTNWANLFRFCIVVDWTASSAVPKKPFPYHSVYASSRLYRFNRFSPLES